MTELARLLEEKPICTILAKKDQDYFKDEKHKCEFEELYRKKYSKEYEWR